MIGKVLLHYTLKSNQCFTVMIFLFQLWQLLLHKAGTWPSPFSHVIYSLLHVNTWQVISLNMQIFVSTLMGLFSPLKISVYSQCHLDYFIQGRRKKKNKKVSGKSVIAAKLLQLCPTLCDPHGPARLLCPWGFPGNRTVESCHFLLQGIFLTPDQT